MSDSREDLQALIEALLPTNNGGLNGITAEQLREVESRIVDGVYNKVTDRLKAEKYNDTYNLGGFLDAIFFCAGEVNAYSTVTKVIKGVFSVAKPPEHKGSPSSEHRITHNLGHSNYICLCSSAGNNWGTRTQKSSCFRVADNYCDVCVSNDSGADPYPFGFVIINLQPFKTN